MARLKVDGERGCSTVFILRTAASSEGSQRTTLFHRLGRVRLAESARFLRALFRYADWEINLEVRAGAETAAEIFAAFCCDAQPELHRAGKREMTSWSTCQRAEDACQGKSEAAAWDPPASVLHAAGSGRGCERGAGLN